MQNYDWNDLQAKAENAGGGEPLPTNKYDVTVATAEAKTSSTGKPMLKVKAKVIGGPHDGRTLWNQYTLSADNDTAVSIFLRHMAAFGFDRAYFATNPSFEKIASDMVGKSVNFDVGQKVYQGTLRNEVNNTTASPTNVASGVVSGTPAAAVPTPPTPAPAPAAPPVPAPTAPTPEAPLQSVVTPPPAPAPAPAPPAPEVPTTPAPPTPPF